MIFSDSIASLSRANRQSSTPVALSENSAKLTPSPSQVAPRGYGWPGQTRIMVLELLRKVLGSSERGGYEHDGGPWRHRHRSPRIAARLEQPSWLIRCRSSDLLDRRRSRSAV